MLGTKKGFDAFVGDKLKKGERTEFISMEESGNEYPTARIWHENNDQSWFAFEDGKWEFVGYENF